MTEKTEGAISERSTLTEAEKSFVHKIAENYLADGMQLEHGYVIGWMMICSPAKQSASQIAAALDIPREPVDWVAGLLTPAGVFTREEIAGGDDYYLTIDEAAWPNVLERSFRQIPAFYLTFQQGMEMFKDEPEERTERLRRMEELYGVLSQKMEGVFDAFEAHRTRAAG